MLEALQEIYADLIGDYETVLTPKTKIDKDLKLSSLGKIQLICAIEEKFDIEIPNEKYKTFKKIKDIIDFIEENK